MHSLQLISLLDRNASVISRKSTPIAVLRHTLGPHDGQEDVFAATVDCSVSWVKKVSAGLRNITPQTARLVSMATGVSEEWLLKGDPKAPILEQDSVTPYTRDSYERWRRDNQIGCPSKPLFSPNVEKLGMQGNVDPRSVAMFTVDVIKAVFSALETGKGNLAVNDLWKYAKVMKRRYGSPSQGQTSEDFTRIVGGLVIEAVNAEARRRQLGGDR